MDGTGSGPNVGAGVEIGMGYDIGNITPCSTGFIFTLRIRADPHWESGSLSQLLAGSGSLGSSHWSPLDPGLTGGE
jgi:hypothetical protein